MRKRVRRMGLRRSRYIGEPRTHLQHVARQLLWMCGGYMTGWRVLPHIPLLFHTRARFMKEAT
jgi:hypothetical protein